jgi:hypothetical protein
MITSIPLLRSESGSAQWSRAVFAPTRNIFRNEPTVTSYSRSKSGAF